MRRPLLPPVTPPHMPHGLQRGGVFDAAYVPPTYIDARRRTVPTSSPPGHDVAEDIFRSPVMFMSSETVRTVTGPFKQPGMAGFGQEYYFPGAPVPGVRVAAAGYGQLPTVVHDPRIGFGRHVPGHIQGMGWQRGAIRERVGAPPLPIGHRRFVQTPHGMTEGGIFGQRQVINGIATGGRVAQQITRFEQIDRRMPGLQAYGMNPDGLG